MSVASDAGHPRSVALRLHRPTPAALAFLLGAAFTLGSLIWLRLDHGVPVYDGGMHLWMALDVRDALAAGHPFFGLAEFTNYPPLIHMYGALAFVVGGLNADAPVAALLIVFVPVFVAGCYVTGRIAYGPWAGLLAVVFGLASPLFVAQIRTFMLDAPEAALVAAATAALLAGDRFRRPWAAAGAGVLVGLGLMTKQSFVAFIAGVVLVMLVRGGWRRWRGLLAFVVPVLVIAGPWYVYHLHELRDLARMAGHVEAQAGPGSTQPARWSAQNLAWYGWSLANVELLVPLGLLALAGTVSAVVRFARHRDRADFGPELLAGLVVGWLAMTWQAIHDPRYMLPALVFLAVLGTGWLTRLRGRARLLALLVLVAAAIANTVGDTAGGGQRVAAKLPGSTSSWIHERSFTIYAGDGYQGIGAVRRQADLEPILRALRRDGYRRVAWPTSRATDFSAAGVIALADLARLEVARDLPPGELGAHDAYLLHLDRPSLAGHPPCLRLFDGTGLWLTRGSPLDRSPRFICPR